MSVSGFPTPSDSKKYSIVGPVWIGARFSHLLSISGLAIAAALLIALPNMASAQCLLNGTTSSNTGTTGNDTVLCDPANDPAGAAVSTGAGSDTIDIVGGVTVGPVRSYDRNERNADQVTVIGSTVNGRISTSQGNDVITITGGTVTGGIGSNVGSDRITITGGSVVANINANYGNDAIIIEDSTITGDINGHINNDRITITNSTVGGNVIEGHGSGTITLNAGANIVGDIWMAGSATGGGAGQGSYLVMNDGSLVQGNVVGSNAGSNGGTRDHPDRLTLAGGTVMGNVHTFGARDQITLNGTTVMGDIDAGVHNDSFNWLDGVIGGQVFMGADDDSVIIGLTTRDVDTIIDGGAGIDSFHVRDATTTVQPATIRGFESARSTRSVVTFDSLMLNGVDAPGDNNLATDLLVTRGDVTLTNASVLTNLLGSRDPEILRVTGDTVVSGVIEGAGNRDTIEVLGNASVTVGVFGGGAGHNGGGDAADTITINTTGSVGTVDGGEGLDTIDLLSGTVGTALGGVGDDMITLDGATITGIIDGGADNDAFIWSSGTMAGFQGGDGSDTATVTAAEYDGTQILDGGDDLGVADSFIDVLTFGAFPGGLNGGNLLNWEAVGFVAGITQQIDDLVTLQVRASCGGTTTLGGASMSDDVDGCISDDTIEITGTTVIAVDVDGAGGSDTITVSGDASVTGAVRGDGEGQDASGAFDDADTITISTTGTVGSVHGGAGGDAVVLSGGTIGSATGDEGADTITLDGATVSTTIDGGADADTIALNSGTVADVIGGTGNDTITLDGATVSGGIDAGENVDTLSLLSGSAASVDAGSGADTITLDGAVISGTVVAGDGDDRMVWPSGNMAGFDGGDGSDLLTVTAAEYDLSQILDGGDDSSIADGFIDELTLDGVNGDLTGGNLVNWEFIHLTNVISEIEDLITANLTTCGGSLVLSGASAVDDIDGCIQADTIEITDTTVIANDIDGAGGSDTITISGDASVTGAVRGDGPGQDDSAAQDAADIITIDTTGTVGSVHGGLSDDSLSLLGGTIGSVFGDSGEDTITLDGATVTDDIESGDDADTVDLLSGTANTVTAGSGDDTVTLDGATVTTDLRGAAGEDLITVTSGLVGGDVYLGTLANTTTDEDTLVMTGGTITRHILGDRGDDTITLRGGDIGQDVRANWGDDTIILNGTTVGGDIDAGRDADTIVLLSGSVRDAFGGDDSDTITLDGATVTGSLRGGDGMDLITVASGSVGDDIRLGRDTSTDEDTLLMTGGTVDGGVVGDRGNDTITLAGGSVALDVNAGWGDDVITLEGATVTGEVLGGLGDDVFTWSSGTMAGFDGGDGSDIAEITASEYDGSQPLDGGDDVATGDGFVDRLTLNGLTLTVGTGNISNWESVTVLGGPIDFGSTLEVGSGPGLGLIAGDGGTIVSTGDFSLTGDLVTEAGGVLRGQSGGPATISVSGNVQNAGILDFQDGAVGDSILVGGSYGGSGAIQLDADATTDTADVLTITGDVVAGGTTIFVADLSPGSASRNDILLIDVAGATAEGDFVLADGNVELGGTRYELNLVGSQWFLQAAFLPANLFYEALAEHLNGMNELLSHRRRFLGRTWLDETNPPCETEDRDRAELWECRGKGAWVAVRGSIGGFEPQGSTTASEAGIPGFAYDTRNLRLEFGYEQPLGEQDDGQWVGGVWGFHGRSSLSGSSDLTSGSVGSQSFGIGASLTWYDDSGLYVDTQIQIADIESDITVDGSELFPSLDGASYAASIEVGKPYQLNQNLSFTPELQYMHYEADFDTFSGLDGEEVRLLDGTSREIRLGGVLEHYEPTGTDELRHLYLSANLYHRLDGTTRVLSDGDELVTSMAPWRGEIGIGASREWFGNNGARTSLFAEVAASSSFGSGSGSSNALRGNFGFEIEF